jgi:ribosomal protein S18 acetylase RimI-like enzyme
MVIRPITLEDAPGVAWVRQQGWKSAYRRIVPDEVLDQMDYAAGIERWSDIIRDPAERCLFCAEIDKQIVGFCVGGLERDLDPDFDGEMYALYVLPEKQRCGVGRALMQSGLDWLSSHGYRKMLIWVLRDNLPARRFYEVMGGTAVRERFIEIGGVSLAEVGYGYDL